MGLFKREIIVFYRDLLLNKEKNKRIIYCLGNKFFVIWLRNRNFRLC